MTFPIRTALFTLASALGLAQPTMAEQLFNDNVVVTGNMCVGPDCATGDADFNYKGIVLEADIPKIHFNSSNSTLTDWRLQGSATNGGARNFSLLAERTSGTTTPLLIRGQAPTSSFVMENNGDIGFGTGFPQAELHVMRPAHPALRLEQDTSGGLGHHTWDISAGDIGLLFTDVGTPFSITPMVIENGASPASLYLKNGGNVGLGTNLPEGKLHTRGNGVQLAYFESGNGDAVQVRFRTDSENRRFLAVDNADNVKTQMQFRDDAILFLGQTVAQEWLRVDASGITTAGPTCNPNPCDATFDAEAFTIPPLKERAAYMWEQRHLPAIGVTAPGQPMNMTEKMGGVIHELELAHIYIEQLHDRLEAQDTRFAAQEDQIARLTALVETLTAR